jgi:hypothetical protein
LKETPLLCGSAKCESTIENPITQDAIFDSASSEIIACFSEVIFNLPPHEVLMAFQIVDFLPGIPSLHDAILHSASSRNICLLLKVIESYFPFNYPIIDGIPIGRQNSPPGISEQILDVVDLGASH